MPRPTSKLAAYCCRVLQTGKGGAFGRRASSLSGSEKRREYWAVSQAGGGLSERGGESWACRRHCHVIPELAFAHGTLAPKRLGLRIISSKTDATDVCKQQEHLRCEQGFGGNGASARDERSPFGGGVKYSVIRINDNGTWEPLILNTSELGVHAKDLDLLAGNFFIPKRSAIAVRNNQILVRMENVRALICRTHCLLFDAHRPRKSSFKSLSGDGDASTQNSEPSQHAREAFASLMADHAKQLKQNNQNHLPFHLHMIECLLDETCSFFHQKVERLKWVAERILEELTTDVSTGGLQRLLPLKRALTEVEHDVRDTHEAMDQILGSDDTLDALYLQDGQPFAIEGEGQSLKKEQQANKLRQAAADMFVSYQREIDDAGGALEEMRKGMDSAQEVWELGLDTTRNRIITMNLYISIATVTLSLAAVPASYFGMNLTSGIEDHPHMFYWVVGTTSMLCWTCFIGLIFAFRFVPTFKDKRRAQDLAALRDLLQHMDAIDDIFQSVSGEGSRLTREQFEQILKAHSTTRFIRKRELDLIFRMFDGNRNRMLETSEWNALSQKHKHRVQQTWGKDL